MPELIRKLKPEETTQVRGMWVECFPDGGPRFVDWFFSTVYRPERTLGAFESETLLSNLQMIPYTVLIRGNETPVDTLSGVATSAAYRNRGLARAVMVEALDDMAARGLGFTFLYPFSHPFYQRLGWETCSMAQEVLLPYGDLPADFPDGWGLSPAKPDIAVLSGIYGRFMASCNCRSVRDDAAWYKRITEIEACDGYFILVCHRGVPQGYAFCEEQESEVNITELACTRAEALPALLAGLKPKGKTVCFTVPEDFRTYLLPGRWKDRIKIQPHVMFRVTDVCIAFGQAAPACAGELIIRVHSDTMRPGNDGVYHIRSAGGVANATRTNAQPEFTCGIGALARILTGFMDAREAVDAGLAVGVGQSTELFCSMYPKQMNFLFELY